MSLNIKNERTHALVRELATLRGVSQTDAATDAVEQRLAGLRSEAEGDRRARRQRILDLTARTAPYFREAWGDRDPTEDLYDENGLPR